MRLLIAGLLLGTMNLHAASRFVTSETPEDWASSGRERYEQCEFKDAARAFTKALRYSPDDAGLHLWLGRSYARMAEAASPLHSAANARQARRSYERAVELQPRNQQYL